MVKRLSINIAKSTKNHGSINHNELEVVAFGLEVLIYSIINLVVPLTIGFIINQLSGVIAFIIVFCIIRQYSGGYHSKTGFKCIILFQFIIFSSFIINRYFISSEHYYICYYGIIVACILLLLIGPKMHSNEFRYLERLKENRRHLTMSIMALIIISTIFYINNFDEIKYLFLSILYILILQIYGVLTLLFKGGE